MKSMLWTDCRCQAIQWIRTGLISLIIPKKHLKNMFFGFVLFEVFFPIFFLDKLFYSRIAWNRDTNFCWPNLWVYLNRRMWFF